MRPDDKRQSCVCGHRYGVHAKNGGPCLAADTPPGQITGQGCQCHAWHPWSLVGSDRPGTEGESEGVGE